MGERNSISIVVPVYNENRNVKILYNEIVKTLKNIKDYEIVFVDDGSTDGSYIALESIASNDKKIKVVKLLTNFGQSNAIAAGISSSKGEIIVTMDSDLQHDPNDILPLVKKIKEGYHVVCGWRKYRGSSDSLIKKTIPSRISNYLIRLLIGIRLNDSTGGMRAFSRKVVKIIPLYGEMHRYLPVLAHWRGFRITEVPIRIRKRLYGKTKYDYKRLFRGFMDLITIRFFIKYSKRPTHIFIIGGILSFFIGTIIGTYYVILNFVKDISLVGNLASLLLVVVLILLGVMFFGFGFIVDMISFDAISSQKRETYVVDKVLNKNH